MIEEITSYFGQQPERIELNCIGHSSGAKITFFVGTDKYFAKEVPKNAVSVTACGILSELAEALPEAIIPIILAPLHSDNSIHVAEFVCGHTLDLIYEELSFDERFEYGLQVGHFLSRLHKLTKCDRGKHIDKSTNLSEEILYKFVPPSDIPAVLHHLHVENSSNGCLSLIHGDIRPQNIIIRDNRIAVVDFDNCEFASPYFELTLCMALSAKYDVFKCGVIEGYFNRSVPDAFWASIRAQMVWRLIDYALRYENDDASIKRKYEEQRSFLTSNHKYPEWWRAWLQY